MLALYIIAGIIILVTLTLFIPIELVFHLETAGEDRSRIRVGWLFGLAWKDIGRGKKKPKKKKKRSMKPFLSLLRIEGVPSKLLRLVRQIFSCFKIRQLDADLRIGLDDPADTGMLYALLWPAFTSFNSSSPMRVNVEPSFTELALEVDLRGRIRLFPIKLVGTLLRFVLSPTGLRALRSMVVSSWKKKR